MERGIRGKRAVTILSFVICAVITVFFLKAYREGKFNSVETLKEYIAGFGMMGPIILGALQAFQVIVPVLPGFIGCAAGAVLFGCMGGFWCNYIGISAGSVIAFLIARKYGIRLIHLLFPSGRYEKWAARAGKSRFYSLLLFMMILLPLCPDDYFCYFSGITKMSVKKFVGIIMLGKPWCILAYSVAFSYFIK